jgi:hypothetical protein
MLGEKQVSFIVADDQATKYRSENAANVGTSHFTQKNLKLRYRQIGNRQKRPPWQDRILVEVLGENI